MSILVPGMPRGAPRPLVISHRTNMGASPENTLEGIAAALEDGVDAIEVDVRASADGVPFLLHDATLERTHRDPRMLSALSSEEARALGLPTLEDALAAVAGRAALCLELKEPALEGAVRAALEAAGATQLAWVWAFDPAVASASREAMPSVPVALNVGPASTEAFGYTSAVEEATTRGLAAVSLDARLVTPALVAEAHARGLLVFTWTVDAPGEIARVLDAGVDGVCGNHPSRVAAARLARAGRSG